MVGVVVFPANSKDADYRFFKNERKVLEISDEEIIRILNKTKGIYFWMYYLTDFDNKDDKEIIDIYNERSTNKIEISSKHSGLGYSTADKNCFVRIIKNTKEWYNNIY